jgi:hypothetical protein
MNLEGLLNILGYIVGAGGCVFSSSIHTPEELLSVPRTPTPHARNEAQEAL